MFDPSNSTMRFIPEGGHDASRALSLNSRVLPWSLSICRRSGEGSLWRPTLLPWCRLTVLPSFRFSLHTLVATVVTDSSHNLVYCDVVMSMQWGYITILTAYIISASRDFVWFLKFHHAFYSRGQAWCFAGSVFKFTGFALIIVILPTLQCRKFMVPHPPPLVPVDGATLVPCCIP